MLCVCVCVCVCVCARARLQRMYTHTYTYTHTHTHPHSGLQVLWKLAWNEPEIQRKIIEQGGLLSITNAMRAFQGETVIQTWACGALLAIVRTRDDGFNRNAVLRSEGLAAVRSAVWTHGSSNGVRWMCAPVDALLFQVAPGDAVRISQFEPAAQANELHDDSLSRAVDAIERLRNEATALFRKLDKNQDGALQVYEMFDPVAKLDKERAMTFDLNHFMALMDADGDGGITRGELRAHRRASQVDAGDQGSRLEEVDPDQHSEAGAFCRSRLCSDHWVVDEDVRTRACEEEEEEEEGRVDCQRGMDRR